MVINSTWYFWINSPPELKHNITADPKRFKIHLNNLEKKLTDDNSERKKKKR